MTIFRSPTFEPFEKIARLSRECVVTEKIDGTNGQIIVGEDGSVTAASRTRIITPENDNYGFARWVADHAAELARLGPGRHFGEWWGQGIQRKYGLSERRFSLFNVARWADDRDTEKYRNPRPDCCGVVPVLWRGVFDTSIISLLLSSLAKEGSRAAPGFMQPEGVVVYHTASGTLFKKTLEKDEEPKSAVRM